MSHRELAKALLNALPRQVARRNAPQTSHPQSPEIAGKGSDTPNERIRALEPNVGALLYLMSLGVVALATVGVFFGLGFVMLAHPSEKLIAGSDAHDRGVAIAHRSFDLAAPPDKADAPSTTQEASASLSAPAQIPEPHADVLPLAGRATAGSAHASDTGRVNAIPDASASLNQPALRSTADAAVAKPAGNTNAKGTGIGRHRHVGVGKHRAVISRPGTNRPPSQAISGPERAWHWIVRSATGILAAISPPPFR